MTSVSFGSMFNPEYNIKSLAHGDSGDIGDIGDIGDPRDCGSPKDFPSLPDEPIGRSQVKIAPKRPMPHKLKLSIEDMKALSKLTSKTYGFHNDSNDFWVHTKKPTQGKFPNLTMGDGKLIDKSRHEFVNELVSENSQAFQVAGKDSIGGNKLITVVKNQETGKTTMYTCTSKECYPVEMDSDVDLEKLAAAITDNLSEIQGATIWA